PGAATARRGPAGLATAGAVVACASRTATGSGSRARTAATARTGCAAGPLSRARHAAHPHLTSRTETLDSPAGPIEHLSCDHRSRTSDLPGRLRGPDLPRAVSDPVGCYRC